MRLALLRALCEAAASRWLKRPLLLSADAARALPAASPAVGILLVPPEASASARAASA